jgi:hypothetical protein
MVLLINFHGLEANSSRMESHRQLIVTDVGTTRNLAMSIEAEDLACCAVGSNEFYLSGNAITHLPLHSYLDTILHEEPDFLEMLADAAPGAPSLEVITDTAIDKCGCALRMVQGGGLGGRTEAWRWIPYPLNPSGPLTIGVLR